MTWLRWFPFFAVRIQGSSLEPSVSDGDVALALRGGRARPGALVIAQVAGFLLVKRVVRHRDDGIDLAGEHAWGWVPRSAICGRVVRIWSPGRSPTA